MEGLLMWIIDIVVIIVCFVRFIYIADSKKPEEVIKIKQWRSISIGAILGFFLVPLLFGGYYSKEIIFQSWYTALLIPLVATPLIITSVKMVRYYKKQNEEKKVAAIKEKAASEVDKIKLVCKEINEHIEQYYRLCKLVGLLDNLCENNLKSEYMDKKAIFFQNLMKGKQMSTLNLSTQEKQSIAKLISNYKIGMDYIPRISNKINSMTNEDLIKTWRSAKRKPHRFIEKVKELIK